MKGTGDELRALALAMLTPTGATFALVSFAVPVGAANYPSIVNASLGEAGNDALQLTFESDTQLGSSADDADHAVVARVFPAT